MFKRSQLLIIAGLNLKDVMHRPGPSLVIVVGMASIAFVLVSVLSMSAGFLDAMTTGSRNDRAIVISVGTDNEISSNIPRDVAATVLSEPGIKKDAAGIPLASAELLTGFAASKRSNHLDAFLSLRGVSRNGLRLRPEVKLKNGRMFDFGTRELIVGSAAQLQFEALEIGNKIRLPEGDWTIVGSFESGGSALDGMLIGDADTIMQAFRKESYSSVIVQLDDISAFDRFKAALMSNGSLAVETYREQEYSQRVSKAFNDFLSLIAISVGGVMGVGAFFGALNTLYAAVERRTKEIGTLRAIGFSGDAVAGSVLTESLLLSIVGAAIGTVLAWVVFDGALRSVGGTVFHLSVTPTLAALGIGWACMIAIIGGGIPAMRARTMPIVAALRAT